MEDTNKDEIMNDDNKDIDTDKIGCDTEYGAIATEPEVINNKPMQVGALDDMDDITDPEPTYEERVARALANNPAPPCSRNKAKEDKLSKYFTYGAVPFFLISIGFSLFNMGRVRYPLSFLFMSFAVGVLGVGNYLRYLNNKKCNCSICETQAKTLLMSAAIWGLLSIGCLIGFFVMMFMPAK